eukprot:gene17865-biopygen5727
MRWGPWQGNRTTPSYVAFSGSERLIGDAAKNQAAMNPGNTVRARWESRRVLRCRHCAYTTHIAPWLEAHVARLHRVPKQGQG